MKKFKIYSLALLALVGLFSCDEDNDELTGGAQTGGLLTINNQNVGYVVGNGLDTDYEASFSVMQGAVKTTHVDVYKVFSSATLGTSNEILFKSFDVPATPQFQEFSYTFTFNELIAGLTVNGAALPTDDALLNIGDAWTLKYVSTTSDGSIHENAKVTKVSVGTRFAGTYKVIQGVYWRIGVNQNSDWNDGIRIIESVDATTYRFVEYAGPFAAVTNTHYFTVDALDVVRTPTTYDGAVQLINGFPLINCDETPALMTNACGFAGPQNTIVRDDIAGKDIIYRSYGYNTTSGAVGPREFYEVLEKVVD